MAEVSRGGAGGRLSRGAGAPATPSGARASLAPALLAPAFLAPALLACLLLAPGAAAAAGWSRFAQGDMKGALYSADSGEGVFLLACETPGDVLLQVAFPQGAKVKAGGTGRLSLAVAGRRFRYSGKVMNMEEGSVPVLMASVKADDPLVAALAKGSGLKVSAGRAAYDVPLDGEAVSALAAFSAACGPKAEAPAPAAAAAPEAPRQEARATAAEPARPAGAAGAMPSAADLAEAIFVDKKEGQRVAGTLKVTAIDLNGSGASEAIVTVKDPAWCSENGCTLFVVDLSEGKPRVIGEFIGNSLVPAKTRTDGWRDLTLVAPGGTELESFVDGGYR